MFQLSNKLVRSLAAVIAIGGGYVFADTTDTVLLSGSVTSTLTIEATDTAAAATLPLDGAAAGVQQIVKVADILMSTNNDEGIMLTATSGSLNTAGAGGDPIAFQVAVVEDAAAAVGATFTVPSGTNVTDGLSNTEGSFNKDLYIMYTPAALQDPGTYTGSIGLTVADQ